MDKHVYRFPDDFMFQLTSEEAEVLRCQSGTSNEGRSGCRYLPYAFTQRRTTKALLIAIDFKLLSAFDEEKLKWLGLLRYRKGP